MKHKKSGFAQSVVILFIFDNLTKILGFLRSAVITAKLGFGLVTDLFNFSCAIVNTPISLVSDALLAGLIPFLNAKKNTEEKRNLAYSTFLVLGVVILFFALIVFFIRIPLLHLLAVGFKESNYSSIVFYSAFFLLIGIIGTYTRVIEGFLRTEQVFGVTNKINLIGSIVSLGVLWVFLGKNSNYLVYSLFIGAIVALFGYFLIAPKGSFCFDRSVFNMLFFAIPLFLSASLGVVNNIVDKSFATLVPAGGLTALSYSFLLAQQLSRLVGSPLLGASYSFISKDIAESRIENLNEKLRDSIGILGVYMFIAIGAYVFGGNAVLSLLFRYGKVSGAEIGELYSLTAIYLVPCFFSTFGGFLIQVLYSYKNSLSAAIINGSMVVLNIFLNYLFVSRLGSKGLALASLIVSVCSFSLLNLFVFKRYKVLVVSIQDSIFFSFFLLLFCISCGFGVGGVVSKSFVLLAAIGGLLLNKGKLMLVVSRILGKKRSA